MRLPNFKCSSFSYCRLFFFSSRRRHTRCLSDWSSDVCSSDLRAIELSPPNSVVRTKCANTRGVCYVTKGEWAAAEREFRAALQSAEEQQDERHARLITHNLGLPALMRGDFDEALRWLGRMLRSDAELPPMPQ